MNSSTPAMRGASGRTAMASLEFTAKDATELVGVTVRTLRHYQQLGLIPEPRRTPRGLIYDAEHVLRLLQIKRLTAMSLSLDEVADIIADPSSSRATRILIELDQALADRVAEIQSQRRAISESLQTNSPVDIVPQFARHVAALRRLGGQRADAADQALVELVAGFGDQSAEGPLMAMVDQITNDPLTIRLTALEERLRKIDDASPEADVAALALAYGQLLTDMYDDYTASMPTVPTTNGSLYTEDLPGALVESVENGRQRDVLSRAVTVLAAHTNRD